MMEYAVFVEGLDQLTDIASLSDKIRLKAVQAINKIARDGRSSIAIRMEHEINFPPGYLAPAKKRLYVKEQATRSSLEAVIAATGRPTSLARFVQGNPRPSAPGGVTVRVGNKTKHLKRAFLMRLRSGNNDISDNRFNLGLAVRLKPGETLTNKRFSRRIDSGLYLLYGPSVDQVFLGREGSGVAADQAPDLAEKLENEFLRLMEL
jgi:hypothetical protein